MSSARPLLTAVVHARTVREEGLADAVTAAARLADEVLVVGPAGMFVPAGSRALGVADPEDTPAVRRAAETAAGARWLVWQEPHERLTGDGLALRCVLAVADAAALTLSPAAGVPWPEAFGRLRVTRAGVGTWEGRVRPRYVGADGRCVPTGEMPEVALGVRAAASPQDPHEQRRRAADVVRAERDVRLAPDGPARARALLALGHTRLAAADLGGARSAFADAARDGGTVADRARDLLARIALAEGRDQEAVDQARQLSGPYAGWLAAQGLAQLGDVDAAWELVRGLEETRGPDGLAVPPGVLHEMRALLALATGHPADAVALMTTAMATDGQIAGRGPLLREVCALAGVPLDTEALLARALPEHRAALARELAPARAAA